MKDFIRRLSNISGNLLNAKEANFFENGKHAADLHKVIEEMSTHMPGISEAEYVDIQAMADIAERNGKAGDGLDREFVQFMQDAQKLLMIRGGSRTWQTRSQRDAT